MIQNVFNLVRVRNFVKYQVIGLTFIFLFSYLCLIPSSSSQPIHQTEGQSMPALDGQILFSPMWSTTTYLIDTTGRLVHTWESSYLPGVSVCWLGDGTILRTIRIGVGPGTGGAGGGVQKVKWDGTVEWDFRYNTNGHLSHHDLKTLPNGNVLLIAWETKTRDEAINAGRDPNHVSNQGFYPDHIIEVHPTGPTTGEIVWEWHVWDHLIQDFDPSKENYGVVRDHPGLIDVNFGSSFMSDTDWLHTNSIDYNPEFDQILISVHNFGEIWIIDHSTTTEEAAGHSGGHFGKGGDLLYRWGNPQAYDAGTAADQKLFGQHDASWVKPGLPGEGNILIFNNGINRPGGQYSSVDEIQPPEDTSGRYYLAPDSAYGPQNLTWTYTANPPSSFYASFLSGATRIADGNTLISNGEQGKIFEVTPGGSTIWEYTSIYPSESLNDFFKAVYIPPEEPTPHVSDLSCSGSLSWSDIKPGSTVNGSFQVQNIGDSGSLLNWSINTSSISWGTWSFTPESGRNLRPEDGPITVHVSVVAPNEGNTKFEGYVKVENQNNLSDYEQVPVTLKTPTDTKSSMIKNSFIQFLLHQFPMTRIIFILKTLLKICGFY